VTDVLHTVFQLVFEGAVVLIDIEIIPFKEIVGYIDVGILIAIHITHGHTEAEADKGSVDTGILADVNVFTVIIPVQVIAAAFEKISYGPVGRTEFPFVGVVECINWNETVVDNEAIEITILIIIEECGVGGVAAFICETVFSGFVGEGQIMIIDEELTFGFLTIDIAGVADEDVEPAIVVNVGHNDAGTPVTLGAEACFGGDVFELPVAFVEIEFIGAHVGGEENIGPTIVIDITDSGAATVIKITVAEDVEVGTVPDLIAESDAGLFHLCEQRILLFTGMAGSEDQQGGAEYSLQIRSHLTAGIIVKTIVFRPFQELVRTYRKGYKKKEAIRKWLLLNC